MLIRLKILQQLLGSQLLLMTKVFLQMKANLKVQWGGCVKVLVTVRSTNLVQGKRSKRLIRGHREKDCASAVKFKSLYAIFKRRKGRKELQRKYLVHSYKQSVKH